eukprot:13063895-Heterocapsa_arctica.AAC.2
MAELGHLDLQPRLVRTLGEHKKLVDAAHRLRRTLRKRPQRGKPSVPTSLAGDLPGLAERGPHVAPLPVRETLAPRRPVLRLTPSSAAPP